MEKRLKIFISAYACEPGHGSEIGVGWHWVLEMSRYFDLWVLTRESNRESIESYLAENSLDNPPQFIYYDLPKRWRFWKKGLRGVRLYYMLWQSLSNRLVKECMRANNIEIYHLLTYGNALWPVSRYGQRKTFIWGPTSAGNYISSEFSRHYCFLDRLKELVQRFMAKTLRFNLGFRRRCRCAKLILCKTEQTLNSIPERYRSKAMLFTDVAVELQNSSAIEVSSAKIRYLAVGRLEGWRGFDMLIEAFTKASRSLPNIELNILGRGADRERLERLIRHHGVENVVSLVGQVSIEEYYKYMASCDVVVNPSLKEGAVTTAFDSISFAKPLICIDTGGYTRYFSNDYAIVIEPQDRACIVDHLADAIIQLSHSSKRVHMAEKIISIRDRFTWQAKGMQIRDIIKERLDV